MEADRSNTGYYIRVKCPNCGRNLDFIVTVAQLPAHRIKRKGEIESILTPQEYERFQKLATIDKIVFSVGKFYDAKRRWPSENELSSFIGLSVQTISKYVNETRFVSSKSQEKGIDGKFQEKKFCLTEEGNTKYSELIYKLIGYT